MGRRQKANLVFLIISIIFNNNMELTYLIKTTPDPVNPNEQSPGNTIIDDRIYGHDIVCVCYSPAIYTADYCTKPTLSNTLVVPSVSWSNGETINVTLKKPCNC